MSKYNFIMPWPPSVNGYWRSFKGKQIISKRGRDYRNKSILHLKGLGLYEEMIEAKVSVSLTLNPPTLRKYDVDNFNKALFDSLTAALFWVDDEQIHSLKINKGEKVAGGNVEIEVRVI